MRTRTSKNLFFVLCLLLCGCGGGDSKAPLLFPLATRMRSLQPGDTWTYNVTGYASDFTIPANLPVTGTLTKTVELVTRAETSRLALTESLHVTGENNFSYSQTTIRQIEQNEAGDVLVLADTEGGGTALTELAAPDLELPGTWQKGFKHSHERAYNNGVLLDVSLSILDSEKASSPLGTFEAWKTKVNTHYAEDFFSDSDTSITRWYAPQISSDVQGEWHIGLGQYLSLTVNYVLQSTNVPLQ